VVRKRDLPLNHAVFLRSPSDKRVVWPIPALDEDLVYIGTTDTDYDGPMDHVTATAEDVEYLLEAANFAVPTAHLGFEHVVATWAGLRPLVKPEGSMAASSVSREHQILTSPAGLLTIAGGKMTTARVMGLQVVEHAVELLGANFGIRHVPASRSATVPVSGGDPGALFAARQRLSGLALDPAIKSRWLQRYGGNASKLADRAMGDAAAGHDLGARQLTRAEVRYAVEEEMARTVTDFFTRRASVFYWSLDGGLSAAGAVSAEMGRLLGWNPGEQEAQVESYRKWVTANRTLPIGVISDASRLHG
jgi:glycerol-3-phosphate dehydrogenase